MQVTTEDVIQFHSVLIFSSNFNHQKAQDYHHVQLFLVHDSTYEISDYSPPKPTAFPFQIPRFKNELVDGNDCHSNLAAGRGALPAEPEKHSSGPHQSRLEHLAEPNRKPPVLLPALLQG